METDFSAMGMLALFLTAIVFGFGLALGMALMNAIIGALKKS